jgi:hypothetical protein
MNLPIKDINRYTYDSLKKAVTTTEHEIITADEQEERDMLSQCNIIYNKNDMMIIQPKTKAAACFFGRNTDWCTAWGDHLKFGLRQQGRYPTRTNQFDKYNELYIILDKKTNTIWQYDIESGQFMDEDDDEINVNDFNHIYYNAAIALAKDIVFRRKFFEKISNKLIIIKRWETMEDCLNDIGTDDAKNYYKTYIKK